MELKSYGYYLAATWIGVSSESDVTLAAVLFLATKSSTSWRSEEAGEQKMLKLYNHHPLTSPKSRAHQLSDKIVSFITL